MTGTVPADAEKKTARITRAGLEYAQLAVILRS
jgi:hypothetical protein